MRVRINHAPGGWRDDGPASPALSRRIAGEIIVGHDIAKTVCMASLTTGGWCCRFTGHMGTHAARATMDKANARSKANKLRREAA